MRVQTHPHKRQKILKQAKGFKWGRHHLKKQAKTAVLHAGQHAYIGRRLKKRNLRRTWIQRINAGLIPYDLKYSQFIKSLKNAKIDLDRKILADLVLNDPEAFKAIVTNVQK